VVHLPVIDSSSTSDVRAKPVDSEHLKSPTFNELWVKVKPDTAEFISTIKVESHSSATTLGSQHSTNVWLHFVTIFILFLILTGQ
jgi:ABC-type arginine transport system permease subunit